MILSKHLQKSLVCISLVLTLIISMAMCTAMQSGAVDTELADVSADTYYLWAENSNGPNFGSMTKPTGKFTYDSAKGYYYYDVQSFSSGDYCFVISQNSTSGSAAVNSQAVQSSVGGSQYYLQRGNYSGYSCFHIWNEKKEAVRISFTSATAGVTVEPLSSAGGSQTETQKPTQGSATQPSTQGGGSSSNPSGMIYCKNDAGWSTVSIYLWKYGSGTINNGAFPGESMTDIGNGIWQYELDGKYDMVIFSNSGGSKTGDLKIPGSGHIYNNKTGEFEIYDTSPLQVRSFAADLKSPQYKGMDITLSAQATGIGDVSYRFSAKNNTTGAVTVLSDYSAESKAVWTPNAVGKYTLTLECKDSAGNTNSRTLDYEIKDDSTLSEPIIKGVSLPEGEILNGHQQTVSVNAGGGKTGTNLLFYKYTVKDSSDSIVNVPYYTKNAQYSFTPAKLGTYTVTVSVQASDNSETARTYTYDSVNETTDDDKLRVSSLQSSGSLAVGSTVKITAAAKGGTAPYSYKFSVDGSVVQNFSSSNSYNLLLSQEKTYTVAVDVTDSKGATSHREMTLTAEPLPPDDVRTLKGDADKDTKVTISDATIIQRYLAHLAPADKLNMANANVDDDDEVSIKDATVIQRYLAHLKVDW